MNGCIIANTPIAVDFWRLTTESPNYVHFLSHMHSDHTKGLSSSWRRPLYCSEVTSRLLKAKFQLKESLIHVLPLGQAIILPLAHDNKETMTVTLIDANHCPGAVMFLFEGYFGKILYTGDFKYSPSMFSESVLQNSPNIDVLYLDNTFNNEACVWPGGQETAEMIEAIITSSISDTNIFIALHNLGKEELLIQIAKKFQRWIVVSPARYETLKLLDLPNVFTTDREASNIFVISQSEVTWKNLIKWNSGGAKTVVIVPSALYTLSKKKNAYCHPNVFLVPYSSHCSSIELVTFVANLCPKKIVPIVQDGGSTCDVSNFDCFLSKEEQSHFEIPECAKLFQRSGSCCMKEMRKGNPQVKVKTAKRKVPNGVVFEDLAEVAPNTCARRTEVTAEGKLGETNVNLIPVTPDKLVQCEDVRLITTLEERGCSHNNSHEEGNALSLWNVQSAEQNGHWVKTGDIHEHRKKLDIVSCKEINPKPLKETSPLQCRKSRLGYRKPIEETFTIPVKRKTSFYKVFENVMAKMQGEREIEC